VLAIVAAVRSPDKALGTCSGAGQSPKGLSIVVDHQDSHPAHPAKTIRDRRRAGRIQDVDPALIPTLRNPTGETVAGDAGPVDIFEAPLRVSEDDAAIGFRNRLRHTILALVRQDGRELTCRQLAVLLTVYLTREELVATKLAKHLQISEAAMCRMLDRLAEFDLIRRKPHPSDRRSHLVARTLRGADFMRNL
jgi:DNA-binding MarR family transcriptional regulator